MALASVIVPSGRGWQIVGDKKIPDSIDCLARVSQQPLQEGLACDPLRYSSIDGASTWAKLWGWSSLAEVLADGCDTAAPTRLLPPPHGFD